MVIVLLGAGFTLAQLYVDAVTYFPVVKIKSPTGLEFTVVHDAIGSRQTCGAENRKFLDPLKVQCKACKLVYARCERRLEGAELALIRREPQAVYVVSGSSVRMLVNGPPLLAKQACEDVAANMVSTGLQVATCIYPNR